MTTMSAGATISCKVSCDFLSLPRAVETLFFFFFMLSPFERPQKFIGTEWCKRNSLPRSDIVALDEHIEERKT